MMMIKGKFEREEAEIYVGGQEIILWNIIRGGMTIYWVAKVQFPGIHSEQNLITGVVSYS